ncbi:YqaJ viral recombinase family protein [Planomonospora parontospora]|uniref:YqaJ viral recombinase family protein n=1 Tax=Planomonospora parontospora TaxID=58119 RepID=UPI00361634D7
MTVLDIGTARLLGTWPDDSPEWAEARRERFGGSDIAAMLGLSSYTSPYSLWMEKKGYIARDEGGDDALRGKFLEPSLAAYFAYVHPELTVVNHPGTYADGWKLGNPDALCYRDGRLVAGAEYKSARHRSEWGEPGSDEIPPAYWVQVQWYMHLFGLPVWYVAMIGSGLDFATYVVEYNETAALSMVAQAEEFRTSMVWDIPPPLDHHPATYRAVRKAHPEIEHGTKVTVSTKTGVRYVKAVLASTAADKELTAAKGRARRRDGQRPPGLPGRLSHR